MKMSHYQAERQTSRPRLIHSTPIAAVVSAKVADFMLPPTEIAFAVAALVTQRRTRSTRASLREGTERTDLATAVQTRKVETAPKVGPRAHDRPGFPLVSRYTSNLSGALLPAAPTRRPPMRP